MAAPKESATKALGELVKVEIDEKKELAVRRTSYEQIVEELRGIQVEDEEDYVFASEVLKQVKTYYKEIEVRRKKVTEPLNAALKEFQSWYRPAQKVLEEGEALLKQKLGDYRVRKEAEKEAQMRAIAEASAKGDFDAAHAAAQDLVITTEVSGVSFTPKWEYQLVDFDEVPREFLCLDHSALRLHIKNANADDPKPIPGIKFVKAGGVRVG